MRCPEVDTDVSSLHAADLGSPIGAKDRYDIGDYSSEQTVWDIDSALILTNMRNGTTLTFADWKAAQYARRLAVDVEKQANEDSDTVEGGSRRAMRMAASVVQPRKKPALVRDIHIS